MPPPDFSKRGAALKSPELPDFSSSASPLPHAVPQVFSQSLVNPTEEALQLAEAVRLKDFALAPPNITINQFREMTDDPRFVDKFLVPFLRIGGPTALAVQGAEIGLAVGGPAAPATGLLGAVVGGVVGAFGGEAGAQAVQTAEDMIDFPNRPIPTPSIEGVVKAFERPIGAAKTEAIANLAIRGAASMLNPFFRFAGRVTGVMSPAVKEAIGEAEQAGLAIGAVDLNRPAFNIVAKVGLVMPIVGGPLRRAREVKGLEISDKLTGFLDDITPPIDLAQLGVEIDVAAKQMLKSRRNHVDALYTDMFRYFDNIGNPKAIPSAPIKRKVIEIIGELDKLPKTAGAAPEVVGIPAAPDKEFMAAVEKFLRLEEFITPVELRALQKNLNLAARTRSGNQMATSEFWVIGELSDGVKTALENIDGTRLTALARGSSSFFPSATSSIVQNKILLANRSHAELKALTETAAAGLAKRADRAFFSAGFFAAGTIEVDELATAYLASNRVLRSPQFIENFEALAGVENRKRLSRLILARAADPKEGVVNITRAATGKVTSGRTNVVVFDAGEMRKRLGLSSGENVLGPIDIRASRQALARLLKGTDISVGRLDNFLKSAARIQATPTGDPSTFLTRKLVLSGTPLALVPGSGAAGGASLAGAAGEAAGSLLSLGAFVVSSRALARLISTSNGLRILQAGLRPNLPRQEALLLAARATRALDAFEEEQNALPISLRLEPGVPRELFEVLGRPLQ